MVKMYRVAKKAQKELITRAMLGGGEDGWEGGAAVKRSGEFGRVGGGGGWLRSRFQGKATRRWLLMVERSEAREGKIKALEMISLRHATRLLR